MPEEPTRKKRRLDSLLSISHDKDVDGLNSAAIVWRYAKSRELDFDVILTDYGGFSDTFSAVAARRNTLLVITDLAMDENELDSIMSALKRAVSQGCRVVWLDHHQWSKKAAAAVLSLGNSPVLKVNTDFCAAEIAYKVLMPKDEISAELAEIAHDTDFNLREIDAANALTDALSVLRFEALSRREDITEALLPLLSELAKEGISGLWDENRKRFKERLLNRKVKHYRKEKRKKMKKALAQKCDDIIHDRLVRILKIPNGVTTTDMGTFAAKKENLAVAGQQMDVADLLITVSNGGMLGFRRGSEKVLCDVAASLFDGGGHPFAAGGEYGMYDDFDTVCVDIFTTLENNPEWMV
ncbi:MAG: DHH family phosphoesterase [Candidatus Thorarchaeota archaeon]